MFTRQAIAPVVLAVLAGLPAAALADTNLRFTTGVDYSTGSYGERESTDVIYAPLTAKLYTGHWTFRASTGWLSVDGPATISTVDEDGGGVDTGGVGPSIPGRRTRQGFGDTYLGAKYAFQKLGGSAFYFDPQVKVRLPTGDHDKGLGVGATDLLVDGELGADWRTRGLYVDIGRRFQGDSSTLVRQDVWAYSVGGWARFDSKTEFGAWYYTRDPSVRGFDRPREIGAYVSRRINAGWRLEFSLYEGLSEASEDFGGGVTITWRPGTSHRRR